MRKFLKRNWGKILLAILLISISIVSFKTGYSYLSNDNYSPDLNPLLTIERSIQSPAWRSYRVLGFASESEQADIFRATLYYILDLFLPTWSLSQIFALLCFVVGSWFTALLASSLVKDSKQAKYSELVFLLSGTFYVSTLWTVWVYYQNMFPYITQFGFLPLLIWSIYRLIKNFNWKNALIFFISSILFASTFVIATLFVVDVLVISFLIVVFSIFYSKTFKEVLKKSVLTILLFISTQLFWILPFVHYTVNVSGDIVDSYINRSITTSVIDLESRDQDALNSAKLFTRTILEKDSNDNYIFERADEYAKYDFFNVIGLLPAVFTIVLLVFALIKRKWLYLVFSLLSVLIWFVMKNVNPPLGNLFVWLQDNIPLFKQVFRWPSSKVGNIYLLLTSISAPIGFIYIIDFLSSFLSKGLKYILFVLSTIIIVAPTLFYAQHLFTGDVYPDRAIVEIPNEYYDMKNLLEENELTGKRILYLPMANNNYFRSYDWGFEGSNFISYIIPNPIMDLSSAIGSKYGEKAISEIQETFRAKDLNTFNELLSKYEVDYLLVDKTLNEEGFTYSWNWDEVSQLWENRELAHSTENLFLYNTGVQNINILTESNTNQDGTFSYISGHKSAVVSLDPELYNNWNIKDNFLVSENIYNGNDIILNNVISLEAIKDFPSLLKIQDGHIYLYPAVSTINQVNTQVYKKYEYDNSDVIVVDKKVLDVSNEYVGIEDLFDSNHDIYTVNNSSFILNNLTSTLSQSTPYECISGEREETTTVKLQGDATGFDLKGNNGNPCIYFQLEFDNRDSDKVLRVNINWESINNSLLGYCIYSQNEQECLNSERYFSAKDGIGNIDTLLDQTISKTDYVSLILYALNTYGKPELTVRKASVSYAPIQNKMNLLDRKISQYEDKITLDNGSVYQIKLPILIGENSYKLSTDTVWQPNISEDANFITNNDSGIYQKVQEGFANSSINLFSTNPLSKYLMYWKGENISNIPASLCIAYSGDNTCWIQDIMYDNIISSNLNIFSSDQREERLDLSLVSTSYNLTTENILNDLVVMEYPEQWRDLSYIPKELNTKNHVSTTYSFSGKSSNSILTVPQASESGWIAISFKNNIPKIVDSKVLVNGWKQGWDISNVDYDSIYVIYYPNLLAYIGYVILVTEFFVILFNLVKRKNGK
ncbi:MAG: hypothetical protein WC175_01480 [Candidatus Dojkabacteria bacterium]|jgi:hypothetical protein|nr:YfhO family protein [Candidatus Dojkabacteria bacterium]